MYQAVLFGAQYFPQWLPKQKLRFLGSDLKCKAEYSIVLTVVFQKHQELSGAQKKTISPFLLSLLHSTLCEDAFCSVRLGSKLE